MENEIGLSRGIFLSPVGPLLWTKVFSGDIKTKWNVSVRPAVPEWGWGAQKSLSEEMFISDQHLYSTFPLFVFLFLVCPCLREYFFMAKVSSGSGKRGAETVE